MLLRGENGDLGGKQLRGGLVAPLEQQSKLLGVPESMREIVNYEEHSWSQNKSQTLAEKLILQRSLNLLNQTVEYFMPQGIIENDRSISQRLLEPNNWV